ncbi:DMT family transporter [Propionimicrobium sp. PCR01-08-3]|uniref:DMT family transporter n=1 Tax=Propionimicrobium sp. PCR01-08-3 TaxID=3052086 RepID=UPI00255CF46F|nr:DMT family transporter [Propionimicrobium sp. PCR01-08-3]WIY82781.1 DMT family transporter [Propionimicrobium sp. PCR01-08-3]
MGLQKGTEGGAVAAAVLGAVLFGTSGTSQAFAPTATEPLSLGAARLIIGGSLLGVLGLLRHRRSVRSASRFAAALPLAAAGSLEAGEVARAGSAGESSKPSRLVSIWIAVAAVATTCYQATFFAGVRANGVAVGTVIALGSTPLFAGLFEWALMRKRPGLRWLVATTLSVLGVVLLADLTNADIRTTPAGVAFSLAAGASYALYTVAIKSLLERGWHSASATSAVFSVAALLAVPIFLSTPTGWITEPTGIGVVVWLAVVCTLGAYLLVGVGISGLPATTVATLALAEPATATGLGVLLLGEKLSILQGLGIVAVAAGVLVAGSRSKSGVVMASSDVVTEARSLDD